MKKILFLYAMSIILSIVFLNVSDTFSINNIGSLSVMDKIIYFYTITSLFFSPLLFMVSDVINYKE